MEGIKLAEYILGGLSIIGCFFIIFVFLCYKKLRSFQFECVVYLTISSMMTTISYLFYYINILEEKPKINELLCNIQAFTMVWFENSQYIWATLIGYSIYQSVIHFEENNEKTTWGRRTCFLVLGYLLPLSLSCIALIRQVFGQSGSWCWIDTTKQHSWEHIIFATWFYSIVWILIIINFILNYLVVRFLDRNFQTQEEREIIKVYMWKLIRYPIIQVLCAFPGSINRFLQVAFDIELYELQIIQIISLVMQGLLYAIAYGYTPQVRMALFYTIKNYFCCCFIQRKESESSITQSLYERSCENSEKSVNEDSVNAKI